jgi:long-chain acyl-CoA synthetase
VQCGDCYSNKVSCFSGNNCHGPATVIDFLGISFILDRLKDMIVITDGENVYSDEVAAVIYEHPAVREAAVFGIPDPRWGELVMACVVLKPGKTLSVDDLITHCRRSLANYKIPHRVEFSETELRAHQERAVH